MTKKKLISSIPRCSNCQAEAELFSGFKHNEVYQNLCERCIGSLGSAEFYRRYDRQSQRRHYAKDIVQPSDSDYAKVYGADQARQRGWSEEDIRRYG